MTKATYQNIRSPESCVVVCFVDTTILPRIAIRVGNDAELCFVNSAAFRKRFKFSLRTARKHPTSPLSLNISRQSVQ